MSQTIISDNTTIKVSSGAKTLNATAGGTANYTVPANSYFILSSVSQGSAGNITVTNGPTLSSSATTVALAAPMHLGPGAIVSYFNSSFVSGTSYLNGVEFINSP